jgi:hypothetical protein
MCRFLTAMVAAECSMKDQVKNLARVRDIRARRQSGRTRTKRLTKLLLRIAGALSAAFLRLVLFELTLGTGRRSPLVSCSGGWERGHIEPWQAKLKSNEAKSNRRNVKDGGGAAAKKKAPDTAARHRRAERRTGNVRTIPASAGIQRTTLRARAHVPKTSALSSPGRVVQSRRVVLS